MDADESKDNTDHDGVTQAVGSNMEGPSNTGNLVVDMETSCDAFTVPQPPTDLPVAMETTQQSVSRTESMKSLESSGSVAMDTTQPSPAETPSADTTLVETPSPDPTPDIPVPPAFFIGSKPPVRMSCFKAVKPCPRQSWFE